jgi:hypothetical protein
MKLPIYCHATRARSENTRYRSHKVSGKLFRVELDVPNSDTRISPSAEQLPISSPQNGVDTTHASILDADILGWVGYAPDVHIGVERAGGAVLTV